ncbi:hypothetical protein [Streptomyces sp. NPDC051546]|uniref:hypothetical protein n=1 Tax=Streptomyces sp. NPDC051546 TaxID=3365655 RepID=UPI00379AEAE9
MVMVISWSLAQWQGPISNRVEIDSAKDAAEALRELLDRLPPAEASNLRHKLRSEFPESMRSVGAWYVFESGLRLSVTRTVVDVRRKGGGALPPVWPGTSLREQRINPAS